MSGELRNARISRTGRAQGAADRFQPAEAKIAHRSHTEMLRAGFPQGPLRDAKCRAKLNKAGRLVLAGRTRILEAGHQVAVSFRFSSVVRSPDAVRQAFHQRVDQLLFQAVHSALREDFARTT